MTLLSIILIVLTILITAYLTVIRRRRLARRLITNCGFPVIESTNSFIQNLWITKNERTPWLFGELAKCYGQTYALMQGVFPTVVTSDPGVVQQICLKQFHNFHSRMVDPRDDHPDTSRSVHQFAARGERWKRLRTLTSKAMSTQNLKQLFTIIDDSVQHFMIALDKDAKLCRPLEIHGRFQRLTFDVISRCCVGQTESEQMTQPNLQLLLQAFSAPMSGIYPHHLFTWCFPELKGILTFYQSICFKFRKLLASPENPLVALTQWLYSEVLSTRKTIEDRHDVLALLKSLEDNDWDDWPTAADAPTDVSAIRITKKITNHEIVAQCRFLLAAGFDTTASSLTYLCYLLASNPEEQEKVYDEVIKHDEISFQTVQSAKLLHLAIMETLRLFPHASMLQSRQCAADCQIGQYEFRKGVCVLFDTWSMHHSEQIWGEDVDRFNPKRFDDRTTEQANSWMPFGAGPRQCIGMRFAMLEMKILMFHLLKKYRILKSDQPTQIQLRLREMGTVWPDFVAVRLEERVSSSKNTMSNIEETI